MINSVINDQSTLTQPLNNNSLTIIKQPSWTMVNQLFGRGIIAMTRQWYPTKNSQVAPRAERAASACVISSSSLGCLSCLYSLSWFVIIFPWLVIYSYHYERTLFIGHWLRSSCHRKGDQDIQGTPFAPWPVVQVDRRCRTWHQRYKCGSHGVLHWTNVEVQRGGSGSNRRAIVRVNWCWSKWSWWLMLDNCIG